MLPIPEDFTLPQHSTYKTCPPPLFQFFKPLRHPHPTDPGGRGRPMGRAGTAGAGLWELSGRLEALRPLHGTMNKTLPHQTSRQPDTAPIGTIWYLLVEEPAAPPLFTKPEAPKKKRYVLILGADAARLGTSSFHLS